MKINMKPRKKSSKSGKCQIVINMEAPEECRIGLLENGRLEAFDIETFSHTQTRGNLYKGRIVKIEPSLQAAFVDIGLPRNGYLPLSDIHPEYYGYAENKKRIHEFLKKNQDILVQIVKEETHIKGSAITTYLSIPARYLVLMPGTAQVGVSRKIEDEEERQRLKQILKACKLPEGVGLIARTVAEGVPKVEILRDLRYLVRFWSNLRKKAQSAQAPALIYRDRDLVKRFLRDYLTSDVDEILVDRQDVYDNIKAFLRIIAPRQVATVRLYQGDVPIFSHFDLETLIEQVYQPNVSMPSGAHIVIEPTEALVSIDVNSGKNIREKNIEETALKTNLEAAEEIARQLRLRAGE
jgi:ribonuclease E